MPRLLIAVDLDGTVLLPDLTVAPPTRAALAQAEHDGHAVVPATARQLHGIRALPDLPCRGWAASSNGAVVAHLDSGEVLVEATLDRAQLRAVTERVDALVPGCVFYAVHAAGTRCASEPGYARLAQYSDHKRDPAEFPLVEREALVQLPANKLVVRHPDVDVDTLFARLRTAAWPEAELSSSGAPFLEFAAPGISKAWGLERLRRHLGIAHEHTVAFGDADNDRQMLAWAGHGVALAHAPEHVRAVADEVIADQAAVATVLARLLTG